MTNVTPLPVLLWHSIGHTDGDPFCVTPREFSRQLDAVVASARTPLTATQYGRILRDRSPFPANAVLLTFDDGYADVIDEVTPSLTERRLSATVFVTSGYLGQPGMLTCGALEMVAREKGEDTLEIGAHSVSHPHLDVLPADRAKREVEESRRTLEDIICRPVRSFAYPHGSYSSRTRDLTIKAGYLTAHGVKNALSHEADDRFSVSRFTITGSTPLEQVHRVLAGTGLPLGWGRERWRTRGYRSVRRVRRLLKEARG